MLLNKFLSNFSYTAVQRSLEYLSHIDYSTIQFTPHHGNIMMSTKIKGTYYYHTHIIYSPAKNAIIGSECSCPVSDYCKHGAALAHVFYTNFLNQDSAMIYGAEYFAKKYDFPVFYYQVIQDKPGYYHVELELISDTPQNTEYGEITVKYVQLLEKTIQNKPQYWLWSHKRWKNRVKPRP